LTGQAEIQNKYGDIIFTTDVNQLFLENKIPSITKLILQVSKKENLIGIEKIKYIKVPTSKNAKWTGLFLGAMVDAGLILVIRGSMNFGFSGSGWH